MYAEHDIALVPVSGALSARTAPALRRALLSLMERGTRRIVLNMAEVPYVDKAGLGVILAAVRMMRERGGLLSIVNVSGDVARVFRVARIAEVCPVRALGEQRGAGELDPSVLPLWRTTLPVCKDDLSGARERIEKLAERLSFGADDLFDITLAAGEALGNALDHTSGEGVLATVSAYPDRLVVEVSDCGEGFEECACASEDFAERGRGIKLMRMLVDSVSICERASCSGTVVRLTKLTPKEYA